MTIPIKLTVSARRWNFKWFPGEPNNSWPRQAEASLNDMGTGLHARSWSQSPSPVGENKPSHLTNYSKDGMLLE